VLFLALFFTVLVMAGTGGKPGNLFLRINPLAAVTVAFATRSLPALLLPALGLLAVAIVMGRLFCGWVCPLGTLNHWTGAAADRWAKSRSTRRERNRWAPSHQVKYLILVPLLVLAIAGTALVGLLDPLSLVTRGVITSWLPSSARILEGGFAAIGAIEVAPSRLMALAQGSFRSGALLGMALLLVVGFSLYRTRVWCRVLCPLGALLGALSRVSLWGMEKDVSRCTGCGRCIEVCQGASEPQGGVAWKAHECVACYNCQAICPEGAVQFRFYPPRTDVEPGPDLARRRLLASVALGAVAFPLLRSSRGPHSSPSSRLLRPPGAVGEEEFLRRCIRCGQCMRVCPTSALQPCLGEGGIEGVWTPVLVPRMGYCEPSCVNCTLACPTGALRPVAPEDKTKVKMGTAFYDRGRCLPWAMDKPCLVCEEHCPVSPKAIYLKEERVMLRDGSVITLGRPMVDPARCVGCGTCEHVCVLRDRAGVYVTSAGESRSPSNQLLLQGGE
jgi:MauM/NapG family ferredoxin protein